MQNFTEKMDRKKLKPVWAEILHGALKKYFKTKIFMTICDFGPLKGTLFYDRNWKSALKLLFYFQTKFYSLCLLDIHQGHLFVDLRILTLIVKKLRKWGYKLLCSEKKFLSFGQNWDFSSFFFLNRVQLRNLLLWKKLSCFLKFWLCIYLK